jgi:cobyrinic acid a,c-diamide synthase
MNMPASLLISGTHCGVGKTTVSFILMSLLRQQGYQVQPFKHGPDFIDPGYHRVATGRESINLDYWMMGADHIRDTYNHYAVEADVAVIEAMGALFDGEDGTAQGSAAQLASLLHSPIVLVIDVYGMTRSVNALLQGFLDFDRSVKIVGVIFNRAGSQKHYEMILDSLLPRFRELSWGYLPRFFQESIQERHLGLLTVEENEQMDEISEVYLNTALKTLNLKPLIEQIGSPKGLSVRKPATTRPSKVSLGVARGKAFCFYYKENLNLLEAAGAELIDFCPIEEKELPDRLDGLYFGGGYPENFSQQLQDNVGMRMHILQASQRGMPIYAECGGLIYLCKELLAKEGNLFSMVGIFPYTVKWDTNYLAIRYVEIKTKEACLLGPEGLVLRGQEFHQTRLLNAVEATSCCYQVTSSRKETFSEGYQINNTLGSYMHLYFSSAISVPHYFISQCETYRQTKHDHSKMSPEGLTLFIAQVDRAL